jgi:site-specific DNA recombinase
MTSAAIYARVSSARQKQDQTIGSQTAALRTHAATGRLEVPEEWVFEDEGHSGATLVRPALERLRDVVAGVGVDVVLCYSPDRLARKFAYQALLIEEFARAGTRVEFVNGPRGDSPEDQLLVQFQGMFAEYEKAQILERYRRGKAHRARTGSVNVLSGAPFGYRYLRRNDHTGAGYEVVAHEATLVVELFRRYADEGATLAELTRWLTSQGVPTRTGKSRWDRSVVWGMLRNPAYAGRAVFGKTMVVHESAGLNRRARLEGRTTPRPVKTVDRPREDWVEIAVPALVTQATFERVAARLEDNKRFASRNSKVPSLLQGLAACSGCGYGYYRTSTRTTNKKIYYYRCLGSDDYRYEGGRVCANKPVRADYLDEVVWDHITGLIADPHLIRTEINKRLNVARTADPATQQRERLQLALARATTAITRMIEAFSEQLVTIDELRARMPDLRARETSLRTDIDALDTQLADRETYLKLADDLEGFLAQLHDSADTADVPKRQHVLRLLVKDVLIGPEKITVRHRIPVRERTPHTGHAPTDPDTEGDQPPSCQLRWGRKEAALRGVTLVTGEVEDILAERVTAVATMLGVSERAALTDYLPSTPTPRWRRPSACSTRSTPRRPRTRSRWWWTWPTSAGWWPRSGWRSSSPSTTPARPRPTRWASPPTAARRPGRPGCAAGGGGRRPPCHGGWACVGLHPPGAGRDGRTRPRRPAGVPVPQPARRRTGVHRTGAPDQRARLGGGWIADASAEGG